MNALTEPRTLIGEAVPVHDALQLTAGGVQARIVLHGQVYTLRVTRAGKLILTK
jgi:hemin uptake protein HemP